MKLNILSCQSKVDDLDFVCHSANTQDILRLERKTQMLSQDSFTNDIAFLFILHENVAI